MGERDEGRVLAMVVRASVAPGAGGLADVGRVEQWAKLGAGFTPTLRRLQERGLVELVTNVQRAERGLRLTPFGRAFIEGQLLGGAKP